MQQNRVTPEPRAGRAILFVLFIVGGWMLFLLGNNWNDLFPVTQNSSLYKWGLALGFLAIAFLLRLSPRWRKYWEVAFALFIAACANAVMWVTGDFLGRMLPGTASDAQLTALDKISQAVPVLLVIILLTWWSGYDLGSIFLKKGNLKWGLRFGFISFGVFAVIFTIIVVMQASGPASTGLFASGVPLSVVAAALPWMLVFCFANGLMEEMWFRGIFLRKLSPLMGPVLAVLATTIIFSSIHYGGTYISDVERLLFTGITFVFGLINGYVMLKSDSVWGSMLFHAGYDLLVILPVLTSG